MNILFLSLADFSSFDVSGIYTDLLQEFINHGHYVMAISPIQKRNGTTEQIIEKDNYIIIKPAVGNITDTPFLEKAVSLLNVQRKFISCIKKYVKDTAVDLLIVATPPVTNDTVIKFVKKTYGAKIYLLLKDIWPGNIFKMKIPGGIFTKPFVHLFFRKHEKKLYPLCDRIGCMSPANVDYIIKHNKQLDKSKIHVNPNSICPSELIEINKNERDEIRRKYGIPTDKTCFIYGGTLGPGQNIYNVVECLKACTDLDCFFVVVGRGLQEDVIKNYVETEKPGNVIFEKWIPQEQYKILLSSCDVGLVFLRYNTNTPSFPSRLLSYMNLGLPVLSCVSSVTDFNEIIEGGKFGWGSLSNSPKSFRDAVLRCLSSDIGEYKKNSRRYLEENCTVSHSYDIIMKELYSQKKDRSVKGIEDEK